MWLLFLAAGAVLAVAVVLAGVTEDVEQQNGAAISDPKHLRLFIDHRPSWLIDGARTITSIGAAPVLGVLAVVAAGALWWRGERLVVAIAPGVSLGCVVVAVAVAKQLVGRARPDLEMRLVSDNEASFPSGHAADSSALFIALALVIAAVVVRRPIARLLTLSAALLGSGLIGLSRLVLAAHWPTDVIAGWALGLFAAVIVGCAAVLAAGMAPPDPDQAHRLRAWCCALLFARRRGLAMGVLAH
jgi:undecaprenyl-diphosphatase